jgi:hypothetical protein
MWRVYLFEFIVVVLVSVLWAHLLTQNNDDESN